MKRLPGYLIVALVVSLVGLGAARAVDSPAEGSTGTTAPLHVIYYYLPG